MPGRVANVRPGYIVGPLDTSRRWAFWPARVREGGEMVIPGTPDDLVQFIDVRDPADWIVHLIDTNTTGIFNATGPEEDLTMHGMVEGCRDGAKASTSFTWVDPAFLKQKGVSDGAFPIWAPMDADGAIHQCNITKAVKAGLTFRTVAETARATLEWYDTLPAQLQREMVSPARLTPEKEKEILEEWKARKQ
ncbi:MAG: hypothetical protein AB1486_14135 [Planctomycetota bacterium]